MGIFTRELAGKDVRTHGNGCYGAQSVLGDDLGGGLYGLSTRPWYGILYFRSGFKCQFLSEAFPGTLYKNLSPPPFSLTVSLPLIFKIDIF